MSWPSRQSQAGYRPSLAPSVGQPIASGSGGGGSRASRAGLPRESIYPVPSGEYLASLEECVRATEGCVSSMDGALAKLQPGIADFPRLTRIFKIEHGYLLMPEPFVAAKKASYAASLQPYIDKLLDRAAELVDAEEARVSRKEDQLAYLEQLITARLPASAPLPHTFKHLDPAGEGLGSVARTRFLEGVEPAGPAQRRRIGMLKMKREKLERERERLLGE